MRGRWGQVVDEEGKTPPSEDRLASPAIPQRVQDLLLEKVRSIEELEILLWFRLNPVPCSAASVARELKLATVTTADALYRLVNNQMLDVAAGPGGTGQFAPSAQVVVVVDELARTYDDYRVETLVLISGNAIRRVRHGALKTFSEAFRIRGDKKNG